MQTFFQITKVDEEKRLVTGRAVEETPDRAGEIFDYETSKPYFEAWSKQVSDDTAGKSLGNVRSMHGNVAAGKLTEMHFDDDARAVDITAKVVDDNEWEKVLEGVHTGFSIGGRYVKKWADGDLKRYTADPNEISLVDRPCIPTAKFFDIQKADGSVLRKAFKEKTMDPKVVTVDELTDEMAKMLNDGALSEAEMLAAVQSAAVAKADAAKAAAEDAELVFAKKDYSDEDRKKMAESGEAMKDGSFPIANKTDLKNAIKAYGRAKDKDAAKKHIEARAKALGAEDMLPDNWDGNEKADGAGAVAKTDGVTGAMDTSAAQQADNMKANETNTSQATVSELPAPKIGNLVSFTFGESNFQGKITAVNSTMTVEAEGGVFTVAAKEMQADLTGETPVWSAVGEISVSRKADAVPDKDACFKASGAALQKGMYGISTFASILGSIQYLQCDSAWEAKYEEDGSTMAADLKAWLSTGCDLLAQMVQEECAELVAGAPDVVEDDDLFMAAQNGGLGKAAAMKYAVLRKLAKFGNEGKAAEALAKRDGMAKLEAKNAELCVSLEKAATESADLRKQLAAKADENEELAKKANELVAEVNKMIAAAKAPVLKSMGKGQDVTGAENEDAPKVEVKDTFGKVDDVASALKKIHQSGGVHLKI